MRVLIVGAAGLLGHTMFRSWQGRSGWQVTGADKVLARPDFRSLDLMVSEAFPALLKELRPDTVVFPASNPFVDYCEQNPQETRLLNVEVTLAAAEAAAAAGARFVFFSTDYVFDGEKGVYSEDDAVNPPNEYGRQKLEVEAGLRTLGEQALVLRISNLFGWELQPKNFVLKVLRTLRAGEPVRAALDQEFHPTYAVALAQAVAKLIEAESSGILHLCGSERMNRMSWAQAVASAFGVDASLITGALASDFTSPAGTIRPLVSCLDTSRAASILGAPLMGTLAGLTHMAAAEAEWQDYAAGLTAEKRG